MKANKVIAVITTLGIVLGLVAVAPASAEALTTCQVVVVNGYSTNPNVDVIIDTDTGTFRLTDVESTPNATNSIEITAKDVDSIETRVNADGFLGLKYSNFSSDISVTDCQAPTPVEAPPVTETPEVVEAPPVTEAPAPVEAPTTTEATVVAPAAAPQVVEAPSIPVAEPAEAVTGSPVYAG